MENTIQIFRYNGNNITFQAGNGDTMVNATQMAKPFRKKFNDWFRLQSTQDFIQAYFTETGIPASAQYQVFKGGNQEQGSWLHEDLALEFARWLSPQFAIWCNSRIKELLRYGFTATETIEKIEANPDIIIHLATVLKEERERHQRELQEEKEKHQTTLRQLQTEVNDERDYSFKTILNFSQQADKTLQAKKEALAFKKKAKDYLFIADGMKHLLKENNIRIPANLLLYREDYEFLNEKDPQLEAFMENRKKPGKK